MGKPTMLLTLAVPAVLGGLCAAVCRGQAADTFASATTRPAVRERKWVPSQAAAAPAPTTRPAAAQPPTSRPASDEIAEAELAAAVERIITRLGDGDYRVRVNAKGEMIRLQRILAERLAGHLEDPDAEIRTSVRELFDDLAADAAFGQTLARAAAERRETLLKFRDKFPDVCRAAHRQELTARVRAVESIGELKDADKLAEPLLLACLADSEEAVQAAAAKAARCKRYNSDAMVDALAAALLRPSGDQRDHWGPMWAGRGDSDDVRSNVLKAIAAIGGKRAIGSVVALLTDDGWRRYDDTATLCETLLALGAKEVVPNLIPLLKWTDVQCTVTFGDQPQRTYARSDVVLLTLVQLTGQCEGKYPFPPPTEGGWGGENPLVRGFLSQEDRTKAIQRFQDWWKEHKDQPPYKDMKPLELPTIPKAPPDQGGWEWDGEGFIPVPVPADPMPMPAPMPWP